MKQLILLCALTAATCACGDAEEHNASPCGPNCEPFALPVAPADWNEFDTGCYFTFRAPPETTEVEVQGLDSCVFQFETAGCNLKGGSGAFSGALEELREGSEYREGQAMIGGFQAKVVTAAWEATPRPFVGAVYFPAPFVGRPDFGDGATAELAVSCDSRAQRDALLPVLATIRFP